MMDLWQLQIFCKIVELKSFSKAGQASHLSQPTVSSHVKDLEEHLGCILFDRTGGREVSPTKAGELLYGYAGRLLALRDETESALEHFQGRISGRLMTGGSTIPGNYILPALIGAFKKENPNVKVSLSIGDTESIVNEIMSGMVDIAVVGAKAGDDKAIIQEKLIEDEMMLIIPADHKWRGLKEVKLEMLFKEPFILREQGSGTLKSIRNSLSKNNSLAIDDLNVSAQMGSTTAVCQAIKGGAGVSILSPIAVKDELETGKLRALTVQDLDLKRNFYLTRSRRRSLSPLGHIFTQFIQNNAEKSFKPFAEADNLRNR